MNVMMVSTSYPENPKDWKSVFVRQLLQALSNRNELNMSYWGPPGDLPENVSYQCHEDEKTWLAWLMEKGGIIHLLRQKGLYRFTAPVKLLVLLRRAYQRQENVSLFHINWLQNALPLHRSNQPIVVSVLGSDLGLLRIPGLTSLLRKVFKKRLCVLAPNADWMKQDLENRFGDVARIITVPLGINIEWFKVKRDLPLEQPHKWLVVSRLTEKKIGPLFDWGKNIFCNESKHELHLFGPMQENLIIPEWVHYHGSTHPNELCEDWFPKVTGLVTMSRHDEGRPQVMLEAMAAGLPIIASDLPAHKDFITHRQTGWLADSEDSFGEGIEWLSIAANNSEIAENAQDWVSRKIGTWDDCSRRYVKIYQMLLDGGQ
ncbi:glycosyltransferase family 4 protein [Desulfopila sp. IMCC35006]|nr:glycosyltransferase family 4 protein [Desulfopila sp. IMCC35006]